MASDQIVAYHRSFLSPDYLDNLYPPSYFEQMRKQNQEVEAIRLRDPQAFEERRKALAKSLKVQYIQGFQVKPVGDQGGNERYLDGNPPAWKVAATMDPTNPPQRAIISPVTGTVAFPFVGFASTTYVDSQSFHKTQMYWKLDQNFAAHATAWELEMSNLIAPFDRGFTPIVNTSWEVVGYMGNVSTGPLRIDPSGMISLIRPRSAGPGDPVELIAQGVPVFVHRGSSVPNGWERMQVYTTEHRVEVRTTIDGQVVDLRSFSTGFLTQPWYSPTDFVAAGTILVNLGKLGYRLTSTYILKTTTKLNGRAMQNGATEALAREVAGAGARDEARQVVGRALSEADLAPLARRKGSPSRVLSPAEMETFLRDVLKKRPYLSRLKGVKGNDDLMKVIREWEQATGKSHLKVSEGAVQRLGSEGAGGWARDVISGKDVLVLEGKLFRAEAQAAKEVMHELAYEAVWEGVERAIPHLNLPAGSGGMRNAMDWLEAVLQHGEDAFRTLRSMGQPLR